MRIGEVAQAVGIDAPTIRYYEDAGILPRPDRRGNGYRDYGESDLRRIELVLALRRLRVPLEDIRALSHTCLQHRCATATRQLLAVIDRRSSDVHRQIEELHRLADRFADLRQQLSGEGRGTMKTDIERAAAPEEEKRMHPGCDCGCSGSGCSCGCGCCGPAVQADRQHERALEVLAQSPESGCDCGCCD